MRSQKKWKQSIRKRDYFAAISIIVLARLCTLYSQGSESIEAKINLSFYHEFQSKVKFPYGYYNVAQPVPLDLDGDAIHEAVVIPTSSSTAKSSSKTKEWSLNVVDLKPLHSTHHSYVYNKDGSTSLLPIYPETIFTSQSYLNIVPVKMASGQIILKNEKGSSALDENVEVSKYYCGNDWHDANENCGAPCPNAQASECPSGQMCYADTSCIERMAHLEKMRKDKVAHGHLHKSEYDSLPSVVSVWSNGNVTMHSITADQERQESLEMKEMWSLNPFVNNDENERQKNSSPEWIDFTEIDVIMEPDAPIGNYGAVYLAARYRDKKRDQKVSTLYVAIDLYTGDFLWKNDSSHLRKKKKMDEAQTNTENHGDIHKPLSSMTRRRSRLSLATDFTGNTDLTEKSDDCLHHFHDSVFEETLGILPHSFWVHYNEYSIPQFDTKLVSSHLDRGRKREKNSSAKIGKSQGWIQKFTNGKSNTNELKYGRPNALAFHNRHGVNMVSMKNGMQVCHLSLMENMLHSDIYRNKHLQEIDISVKDNRDKELGPCDVSIRSDFSDTVFNICAQDSRKQKPHGSASLEGLDSAAPLLVETYDDRGQLTYDIIFALNNGVLKRYDAYGNQKWTARASVQDIPNWDKGVDAFHGQLNRVEFKASISYHTPSKAQRPVLLTGDDKMSLFTVGSGRILDSISFPQTIAGKPLLHDLNGDGTTDVLIQTVDGVWGFCIEISHGSSSLLKIVNILMAILVFFVFLSTYLFEDTELFKTRASDPW